MALMGHMRDAQLQAKVFQVLDLVVGNLLAVFDRLDGLDGGFISVGGLRAAEVGRKLLPHAIWSMVCRAAGVSFHMPPAVANLRQSHPNVSAAVESEIMRAAGYNLLALPAAAEEEGAVSA